MYLLFCTDFYIFRNFVFFVFLVVQYRRRVIYKIKRLDTHTRDFGYSCVTNVEYVRIVHRSRLLDCIKSCCYTERYSSLDLFEPAERG